MAFLLCVFRYFKVQVDADMHLPSLRISVILIAYDVPEGKKN
jgi:hypothetical protein